MASTSDLHVQRIFSVKDYVCVVTGGGTGIGLMATQTLAANGKFSTAIFDLHVANVIQGAKVYITGRRMEVLEQAAKAHNPNEGGQIIP